MTENEQTLKLAELIRSSSALTFLGSVALAEILTEAGYCKQVQGKWLKQEGKSEAICSNCGREAVYQIIDNRWRFENFCPHCGAHMKEDKNEHL